MLRLRDVREKAQREKRRAHVEYRSVKLSISEGDRLRQLSTRAFVTLLARYTRVVGPLGERALCTLARAPDSGYSARELQSYK